MVFKSGFTMKIKTNVVPNNAGTIERTPFRSETIKQTLKQYELANVILVNKRSCSTDLLVGNDYYDIISTKWVILSDGLYLFGSRFECILSGRKKSEYTAPKRDSLTILTYSLSGISMNSLGFNKTDESIFNNSHIEDFWALETIEIKDSLTITDDDKALP